MIKIEREHINGFEDAIRGARASFNSYDASDSIFYYGDGPIGYDIMDNVYQLEGSIDEWVHLHHGIRVKIGLNDYKLLSALNKGRSSESKYRRFIIVTADIIAPFYWWKQYDTYKVGTVANSESTMHRIHAKEFTIDDFSYEHILDGTEEYDESEDVTIHECNLAGTDYYYGSVDDEKYNLIVYPLDLLKATIAMLNECRTVYLWTKDKRAWWQMIQLLPTSYNQRRTVQLNYEVLSAMYKDRKNHKLDEWHDFCNWIKTLPYSELITLEET